MLGVIALGALVWWKLAGEPKPTTASRTPDEMKQVITSVHTRVFSRDNILLTKITEADQSAWQQLVDELQQFVTVNNKDELNDFSVIANASKKLLAALNVTYPIIAGAFVKEKDKEKGLMSFDASKIAINKMSLGDVIVAVKDLAPYSQKLAQLQVALAQKVAEIKKSLITKKIKREVCEVLIVFAMGVELSINKVFIDLQFLLSKKLASVRDLLFGQENLLFVKITKREERAWLDLVEEIHKFVSVTYPKYLDDFTTISDLAEQLTTTMQNVYKKMTPAFPFERNTIKREQLNLKKIPAADITSQLSTGFSSRRGKVVAVRQSLEQAIQSFTTSTPKLEKLTAELVLQLAKTVEDAVQKLIDNTVELFPQSVLIRQIS